MTTYARFLAVSFLCVAAFAAVLAVSAAEPLAVSGQLIELSTTTRPAVIVLRKAEAGGWTDYTVSIPESAELDDAMDAWLTGDALRVEGALDATTGVLTATDVENASFTARSQQALNGWVKSVDPAASTMTVEWQGKTTVVTVNEKSRLVVPPLNPATLADFHAGDRVRLRLASDGKTVQIALALRRGDEIFLKARTRPFRGEVVGVDQGRSLVSVKLAADPGLRADDVNNLVGVAGEIVSVSFSDLTKWVGTSAKDLSAGDTVFSVGRVGDDGVIDARLIKRESRPGAGEPPISGYEGTVTGFEPDEHVMNVKLDATGATWTVSYNAKTKAYNGATALSTLAVGVGDRVIVKGTQNRQLYVITATAIAVIPPATPVRTVAHPLKRERPLADMIRERIQAGLGKRTAQDVLDAQAPEDAEEIE